MEGLFDLIGDLGPTGATAVMLAIAYFKFGRSGGDTESATEAEITDRVTRAHSIETIEADVAQIKEWVHEIHGWADPDRTTTRAQQENAAKLTTTMDEVRKTLTNLTDAIDGME